MTHDMNTAGLIAQTRCAVTSPEIRTEIVEAGRTVPKAAIGSGLLVARLASVVAVSMACMMFASAQVAGSGGVSDPSQDAAMPGLPSDVPGAGGNGFDGNALQGGGGGGYGEAGGAGGNTDVSGGSGGATPGANGANGIQSANSGSGGGGGAVGAFYSGTSINTSTGGSTQGSSLVTAPVRGGNGGNGGDGGAGSGGGGGQGAPGIVLRGTSPLIVSATVTGGNGGEPGGGGTGGGAGVGHVGGAGIVVVERAPINNQSIISAGANAANAPSTLAGSEGILFRQGGGLANEGTISGGLSSSGVLGPAVRSLADLSISTTQTGVFNGDILVSGRLTLAQATGRDATISSNVSANELVKAGPGSITLSGTNTFNGGVAINAGALTAASSAALGTTAAVTINGGTLGVNATALQNPISVGDRGATIQSSGASSLSGSMSGSGPLTFSSAAGGNLALAGADTRSGPTTVTQGTLLSVQSNSALSPNSLYNLDGTSATIELNGHDNTVAALTGTGIVSNAASSAPAVLTVAPANGTFAFDGSITGAAPLGLIKTGLGTQVLDGALNLVRGAAVRAGTLEVNSSLAGAGVTVFPGATVAGTGTLPSTFVQPGGIISPGGTKGPLGTLRVDGNLTLASGALYQADLGQPGTSDRIDVSGNARVEGAGVNIITPSPVFVAGTRDTVLTAAGGVIGTFNNPAEQLPLVTLSLAYDANNVYFEVARNQTPITAVASTPNQTASATGVQGLLPGGTVTPATLAASTPVTALPPDTTIVGLPAGTTVASLPASTTVGSLPAGAAVVTVPGGTTPAGMRLAAAVIGQTTSAGVQQALDLISGQSHASVRASLLDDSRFPREAVNNRLQNAMLVMGPAPQSAGATPAGQQTALTGSGATVWAQGFGAWMDRDATRDDAALKRDIGGFVIGADTAVAANATAGVAAGYSRSELRITGRNASADIDSYYLAGYGGAQLGAWALRGGAAYTWNELDLERSVAFTGFSDRLKSSYSADTAQLFGEIGYPIAASQNALVEPFAGLAYVHMHTDGFTESGGAAALNVQGASDDVGYSTLGVRAKSDFFLSSGARLTGRAMLGWRYAFGDVDPLARVGFVAGGAPFSVLGLPVARNAAVLEAGLDYAISPAMKIGLTAGGQFSGDVRDYGIDARFRWQF